MVGLFTPAMLIDNDILGYSYESDPPQIVPIMLTIALSAHISKF